MGTPPRGPMRTERQVTIEAPRAQVWSAMGQVDRYRTWWPWLRSLDATGLIAGDRWACTVRPPLPYRVTFGIELLEVVEGSSVTAAVTGDVAGRARIDLVDRGAATVLHLEADLRAASRWLQQVDRWAHPVARFGHDRVIDRSLGALATRASEVQADPA